MWSPFNKPVMLVVVAVSALQAQEPLDPRSSIKIDFPGDSPVTVVSADMGETRASARGGAMVLDLKVALQLRNTSASRVRGVTLLATAQEVTPGGKASVALPCIDVGPGEVFPLRLDLRLLRPLQSGGGPLVQIVLDGVLFHDFRFYGPNRLDSRRAMTVWETEAQRDRQYLKSVLQAQGGDGLRRAMLDSLERQAQRPRLDVQVARGRAVSGAGVSAGGDREVRFAFVQFPDAPVEAVDGSARVTGAEARAPRIEVRNRSAKPVRYYEIGWIVKDADGKEYWAASVPASSPDALLAPGARGSALQEATLRFSRGGAPVAVASMTGFVSQVEFADGKTWVPDRASLANNHLLRLIVPSPEEQRLSDLYRKKGLQAVVEELRKF